MKINIYGYDKNNKLVACSSVQGNLERLIEEDIPNDQGKSLLVDAMIAAGHTRKGDIFKTLVCISKGE